MLHPPGGPGIVHRHGHRDAPTGADRGREGIPGKGGIPDEAAVDGDDRRGGYGPGGVGVGEGEGYPSGR